MISLHLRRIAIDKIRVFGKKNGARIIRLSSLVATLKIKVEIESELNERMYLIVFQFITEFIDFFKELMTKSTINPRLDRSNLDFEPIWSKYMVSAP